MQKQDTPWFRRNVAIIASCAILAPLQMILSRAPPGFDKGSWSFPWVIAGFSLFAVVALVGMQAINPWNEGRWMRPTLYTKPLRFGEPLQTFYVGALCAMAAGVGYFVLGIFDAAIRWYWELPFSAGVGVWLGVRLCVWGFSDRFET
jgi:peptidoglycan biosynthesis protein MviN/MurJ (putative lipid II flippase)